MLEWWNAIIDGQKKPEPTYIYTTASIKLSKPRGLMFYAVSLLNPLHRDNHLDASIVAMRRIPDYATVIDAHGGLMDGAFRPMPSRFSSI